MNLQNRFYKQQFRSNKITIDYKSVAFIECQMRLA